MYKSKHKSKPPGEVLDSQIICGSHTYLVSQFCQNKINKQYII